MSFKFIEQLKFRLSGRFVPVIFAADINSDGKIGSLYLMGDIKRNDNSLLNTWDAKGGEIDKSTPMITTTMSTPVSALPFCVDIETNTNVISLVDGKGNTKLAYILSEKGKTINLYTDPRPFPNAAEIIGKLLMMDIVSESVDRGKSIKNYVIGMVIGIILWMFLGPLFGAMLK